MYTLTFTSLLAFNMVMQLRSDNLLIGMFNPLKTKCRLLYLRTQSVLRCKHFSSRL